MTASLSPECRLVFRTADPAATAEEIGALAAAVRDWPRAQRLAEGEGAVSALWRALGPAHPALPPGLAEALRRSALVSDFRMQQLAAHLQRTVTLCAERGIPMLLLKGAAVGALSDPTFRARPMTDVDVLIRPSDVDRAHEAIEATGWKRTTDPQLLALLKDEHHLPPYLDPALDGARLEAHVALLPPDQPFAFDVAQLWSGAHAAPAPFIGAVVPSPEASTLHACCHFAWQHTMAFGAWRTIRSVGTLARLASFDWDRFVSMARDARAATSAYWTLRLAIRLAALPVPSAVMTTLAPPTPAWLRTVLERHFVAALVAGEGEASPSVRFSHLLWRAALRPGWSGHSAPGRWDPSERWHRARGTYVPESLPARASRHVGHYRDWWRFLRRTLFG